MQDIVKIADRAHSSFFSVRSEVSKSISQFDIDTVTFVNDLGIPIRLYIIDALDRLSDAPPISVLDPFETKFEESDYYHRNSFEQKVQGAIIVALGRQGSGWSAGVLTPGQSISIPAETVEDRDGFRTMQVKAVSAATKSVVCFWSFDPGDVTGKDLKVVFSRALMIEPNALGDPPEPSDESPLPANSPRIVVNYGDLQPAGNYLVHEQLWRRCHSCYCLAPGEKKTVIFTQRSGVTSQSEDVDNIAGSMSVGAGAGWAGISASVSASLSASQTITSSQTINRESSSELMDEIVNPFSNLTIMILGWEIIDVYSVCHMEKAPHFLDRTLCSFEVTQVPPVLRHYPKDAAPVAPSVAGQLRRREV